MRRVRVEKVPGIPVWFTVLMHLWARRRCRKVGHVFTHWQSCNHCGYVAGSSR